MKTLKPYIADWSYIINENGNAERITFIDFGSVTPTWKIQEFIDKLTPEQFELEWQRCEDKKDKLD